MKTKFYTLPKDERQRILDEIERLTLQSHTLQQTYNRYKNLADCSKYELEMKCNELQNLREQYDFD